MAALASAVWRVEYRDREGRRCFKYVAAFSPDGAVGQVPGAEKVDHIIRCPDLSVEVEKP